MEIGSLLEKELRILIVKMIQYHGKRTEAKIEKMQEIFTKDLEELKNRDTLEGINSRITEAEEWTNDMENRMVDITATEPNIEKKRNRNGRQPKSLWDIKCINICIIGVPEGEGRKDLRTYSKR